MGFSLLEAMVAVLIIAIIAAMALPSYLIKITREQIEIDSTSRGNGRTTYSDQVEARTKVPRIQSSSRFADGTKIVNNYVKSVEIENVAIHMTFETGQRTNQRQNP